MYRDDPRELKAKFDSTCPETGLPIKKGDTCVYFPRTRKAYHDKSRAAADWRSQAVSDSFGLADSGW